MTSNTAALAGAILGDFTRLDLDSFQRETNLKTSLVRDPKGIQGSNPTITLITIAASAFIFITIVGWFAVLQAYLDMKIVNGEANNSALSRLYFAILTTLITVVALFLFWVAYKKLQK